MPKRTDWVRSKVKEIKAKDLRIAWLEAENNELRDQLRKMKKAQDQRHSFGSPEINWH